MYRDRFRDMAIIQPVEIYDPTRGQRPRGMPNAAYVHESRFARFLPFGIRDVTVLGGACCMECERGLSCPSTCRLGPSALALAGLALAGYVLS